MHIFAAGVLVWPWLATLVASVPFTPPDWVTNAAKFLPKGADRNQEPLGSDFQDFRTNVCECVCVCVFACTSPVAPFRGDPLRKNGP